MGARRQLLIGMIAMLVAVGCRGENPAGTGDGEVSVSGNKGGGKGGGSNTKPSNRPSGNPSGKPSASASGSAAPGGGTPTPGPQTGGSATPTPATGGSATPTPTAGGSATPTPVTGGSSTPTPTGSATPTPAATGTPNPQATSTPIPPSTPAPTPSGPTDTLTGKVVDSDGTGVAAAEVRGYEVGGSATVPRYVASCDGQGQFSVKVAKGATLNIEAVDLGDPKVKAAKLGVPSATTGLELTVLRAGNILGKVTTSKELPAGSLKDVDVGIEGTPFMTKTNDLGQYTLNEVPTGIWTLVANKLGLGKATLPNVNVLAAKNALAGDLLIAIDSPTIVKLQPPHAAAGGTLLLTGESLGTAATPFTIKFGSLTATVAERRPDPNAIFLRVPDGATNGDVTITVDGKTSPAFPFKVLASLRIEPRPTQLKIGQKYTFTVTGKDSSGADIPSPSFIWSATDPSMAVNLQGELTPTVAGSYEIVALAEPVKDRLVVEVVP